MPSLGRFILCAQRRLAASLGHRLVSAPSRKKTLGALARSLGTRAWEEPGRGGPPSREKRAELVGRSLVRSLVYFLLSVAQKRSLDLVLKKRCLDAGKSFSISSRGSAVLAGWPQGGLAPLSLRVWASEGAPCLAQAPQKEKAESASAVAGAGRVSQHFLLSSPRAGARSAAAGKASAPPPPPGTPELTAACPLTQLPPPGRERVRGGGEAWYKAPHAQPARSLSISVGTALTHPPGEYSELGRGLLGRGGREGKELLAARVQPSGPSPPTGIGRAWAERGLWGR